MAQARFRVLAVDDDPTARCFVATLLGPLGVDVELAADAGEFRRKRRAMTPDLFLVDVELPDESGFVVGKEVGAEGAAPVVFLSAHGGPELRVRAFELGALEYLTKPVPPLEFTLRIGNILAFLDRTRHGSASHSIQRAFGGYVLDTCARSMRCPDGKVLALTAAEYDLLAALTAEPGKVHAREGLAAALGTSSAARNNLRIVDVLVWRLRKKLDDDPITPRFIATLPTRGYAFVMPVTPQ